MKLRQFTLEDLPMLCSWLHIRGAYVPSGDEMPSLGWVAYDGEQNVATGFLRRLEGGYAQVDGLATNPECSSEQRHAGQDSVIAACIEEARAIKLKGLIALCREERTIKRAERFGFVPQAVTPLVLPL